MIQTRQRYKLKENSKNKDILLGIDYGDAKIGIAIGRNGLVMPLEKINNTDEMQSINRITRIIYENKINLIIMGIPLSIEQKETYQSKKVRRFSKLLKTISKKRIIFVNEYQSTKESIQEGISKNMLNKKSSDDSLAAALILKRYYNNIDV